MHTHTHHTLTHTPHTLTHTHAPQTPDAHTTHTHTTHIHHTHIPQTHTHHTHTHTRHTLTHTHTLAAVTGSWFNSRWEGHRAHGMHVRWQTGHTPARPAITQTWRAAASPVAGEGRVFLGFAEGLQARAPLGRQCLRPACSEGPRCQAAPPVARLGGGGLQTGAPSSSIRALACPQAPRGKTRGACSFWTLEPTDHVMPRARPPLHCTHMAGEGWGARSVLGRRSTQGRRAVGR